MIFSDRHLIIVFFNYAIIMQTILLITLISLLLLIPLHFISKFYENSKGYPKTNENIDDVIALHKSGERILALRCYRRIYRGKPLKEAVNFLNSSAGMYTGFEIL